MKQLLLLSSLVLSIPGFSNDGIKSQDLLVNKAPVHRAPSPVSGHQMARDQVTGEITYPTPFVLYALGLPNLADKTQSECLGIRSTLSNVEFDDEEESEKEPFVLGSGSNILSIGEGYSGLVPFLNRTGYKAVGLDLPEVYQFLVDSKGNRIASYYGNAYLQKFGDKLVAGNALKLTEIVKPHSQDLILSHSVFYHIAKGDNEVDLMKAISQAYAALKVGGQLHFNFSVNYFGTTPDDSAIRKRVKKWFEPILKDGAEISLSRGATLCSQKNLREALNCFSPDTIEKAEFQKIILSREVKRRIRGITAKWKWPDCYHQDDLVFVIRRNITDAIVSNPHGSSLDRSRL